ncbi:YadA family autotransporter adhesin, partial [Paraburkholderia sp. XV]|uniref:YadA family autotransporter adhesin n=1 Tax=Paraburkholderia sp. XV TaxID=2831520 RepID=UPI0039907966
MFGATAIGTSATASATAAVALGAGATATNSNSVALGANSVANSGTLFLGGFQPVGGTAISASTAAGGEVSVGTASAERRITNVAAGLTATDAVNLSQLMSEDAKVNNISNNLSSLSNTVNNINTGTGGGIKYFHANSMLADSVAAGTDSVAIGGAASAATANSVALGANSVAKSGTLFLGGFQPVGGTAISASTAAGGEVSVGTASAERRITNVAAGLTATDAVNLSQLMSEDAKVNNISNNLSSLSNTVNNINTGTGNITNISNTVNNITNGGGIKYFHANSTLADSVASGTESVAIGGNASATTANSVALGSNSVANSTTLASAGFAPVGGTAISASTAAGEVSVGKAGAERRITNVAAGYAATDAVNVSQLMSEDAKVNNVSNNVSNLSNTVNNIGGNISNINNQVTNIVNGGGIKYFHANSTLADSVASGAESVAIGGNAQATAANSVALGANSTTTANLSAAAYNPGTGTLSGTAPAGEVSVGKAGAERRITNVAAGSAATDAVNVSQLQSAIIGSTANAVAYDDGTKGTVTLKGAGGTKITNLTAGNLSATSTDAVNGSQLYQTNQNVSNLSNNVANIAGNVNSINNQVTNIVNGGGIKYFHANSTL